MRSPNTPFRRSRSRSPTQRDDRYNSKRVPRNPSSRNRPLNASAEGRSHPNSHMEPPVPSEPVPGTEPPTTLTSSQQPPLPDEPTPADDPQREDDGWQPVWDQTAQAFYFFNRFTQKTQWENPRVPDPSAMDPPPGLSSTPHLSGAKNDDNSAETDLHPAIAGGYNPAIHGDYDPNADYAQPAAPKISSDPQQHVDQFAPGTEPTDEYSATASFNRFTGRFNNTDVHPTHTPGAHTDEAKSKRQMNAFFDVDAAANAHDGRSLREERQRRKLSKKEVKEFRERKGRKKEEKKRAWLRD